MSTIEDFQAAPPGAELAVLRLLSDDRNEQLLRTMIDGPVQPIEIEGALRAYPHASLVDRLQVLWDDGIIMRYDVGGAPRTVRCELLPPGWQALEIHDFAFVRFDRSDELGYPGSLHALMRALADGWASGLVQDLAWNHRRRSELGAALPFTHHQLSRRVDALYRTGMVELATEKPKRFALAQRGRETMELVLLAVRWEARHRPDRGLDVPAQVAAALLVAVGLVEPEGGDGVCALMVGDPAADVRAAGVGVVVEGGEVRSAALLPAGQRTPTAWVNGDVDAWFRALLEGNRSGLSLGGDLELARALLDSLFGWLAP